MAKKKTEEVYNPYDTDTIEQTTVGEAHKLSGKGTRVYWRPDGKHNPNDPDNDQAFIFA